MESVLGAPSRPREEPGTAGAGLSDLLGRMTGRRVLVLGDAVLDAYLHGSAARLAREAAIPIVGVARREEVPGGAANAAVNVVTLGGEARLLSAIGNDPAGDRLLRLLADRGVDTGAVLRSERRRTLAKQRLLAGGQMVARFDEGSDGALDRAEQRLLAERLAALAPDCDAVLLSDYRAGVLGDGLIDAVAALQRRDPLLLVVDGRELARFARVGPSAVTPNFDEALALLGAGSANGESRAEHIAAQGEQLLERAGAQLAAVTLDREGSVLVERGRPPHRTYPRPARESCATGAGDTFAAALSLALAAGAQSHAAAELASAAAAVVVGRPGTVPCPAAELRRRLPPRHSAVGDARALEATVRDYRRRGLRVVFTNGCFDILHRGHVAYLNRAKALGDVLVVAANSDASVARLKGPGRPVNPLADRMDVLAALSCVDHIVAFEDDRPTALIEALRPDVLVKGGDYTRQTLPEAPLVEALGGEVQILDYVEDRSTTRIIDRIRAAGPGA